MNLLVGHYQDSNAARATEYLDALRANLANPHINKVFVFLEDREPLPSDIATAGKVGLLLWPRRVRYHDLFNSANRELAGEVCIVANADVSFDASLGALLDYDFAGKLACVSRDDSMQPNCQDAWIFRAPLKAFECNFELGRPGCDNRIAFEARAVGLQLLNPCGTVRVIHHHRSNVRNYDPAQALPGGLDLVYPQTLSGELLPQVPSWSIPRQALYPSDKRERTYSQGYNPFTTLTNGFVPKAK